MYDLALQHAPVTLDQRLTTHAIVGVVVDHEGVGLRHCPAFIEDTAAVMGGIISHYGTADEGELTGVENPAPITRLGYIVSNHAVGQGRTAHVLNTTAPRRDSRIVGDSALGHHQLAVVENTTGFDDGSIIRDGAAMDPQRAALPDINPATDTSGCITEHSTTHQGPGAGRYRDTLFIIRSEEHTSELQSPDHLVCRLL